MSSDFITEFIQTLLQDSGLQLTPEQQVRYVPQLTRQVQERLALEFIPQFTTAQAEEFATLANRVAMPDEWARFWQAAIPQFGAEAERVLRAYATEARAVLAQVNSAS